MRSSSPFGTCVYCGKPIMWIPTKAGKNMPVDPQIISYRKAKEGEKAKDKLVAQEGGVVHAIKVDSSQAEGTGYISHFATCERKDRRR